MNSANFSTIRNVPEAQQDRILDVVGNFVESNMSVRDFYNNILGITGSVDAAWESLDVLLSAYVDSAIGSLLVGALR